MRRDEASRTVLALHHDSTRVSTEDPGRSRDPAESAANPLTPLLWVLPTSLALASLSIWLVPPYLAAMTLLLSSQSLGSLRRFGSTSRYDRHAPQSFPIHREPPPTKTSPVVLVPSLRAGSAGDPMRSAEAGDSVEVEIAKPRRSIATTVPRKDTDPGAHIHGACRHVLGSSGPRPVPAAG